MDAPAGANRNAPPLAELLAVVGVVALVASVLWLARPVDDELPPALVSPSPTATASATPFASASLFWSFALVDA